MDRSQISHVGIAVSDLEAAITQFSLLMGARPDHVEDVASQKVRVAMFGSSAAGDRIELVAALGDDGPIAEFIEKRGEGLHHICLYVDDLDVTLATLREAGVRLIDETPRLGAAGCRVAFVHPSSTHGVLIELEERVQG